MPRPHLIRSNRLPYHVFARSNNKDWFYLSSAEMWEVLSQLWNLMIPKFRIQVHAFVLMSNHFHALVSTPDSNLDEAMLYFMREASREVNRRAGRINHVFGGPYKRSIIESRYHYLTVFKYVHQNPLRAGCCARVEDYPYSSLKYVHKTNALPFPWEESTLDRRSVMDLSLSQKLDWLNGPYVDQEKEWIRQGLHHAKFRLRKTNINSQTKAELNLGDTRAVCTKGRPYV